MPLGHCQQLKEFVLYEEAERAALEVRLEMYKDYTDQELDAPLKNNTVHMKTVHTKRPRAWVLR